MASPISGVGPAAAGVAPTRETASESVTDGFAKLLDDAEAAEADAVDVSERFAQGDKSLGIHEVMIRAEKASIKVRFAATLKNRVIEAYRELMNTQV